MGYKIRVSRRAKKSHEVFEQATPLAHEADTSLDVQRILANPASTTAEEIEPLHDMFGNRTTGQILGETANGRKGENTPPRTGYVQPKPTPRQPMRPGASPHAPAYAIQPKLMVGAATTPQEQEADHVANQVTASPVQTKPNLQRTPGDGSFDTNADFENQVHQQSGGGKPLPSDVRADLEPKFGADFSGVKIHADAKAAQLSQDVGAQAFTHGNDIYFNQGKYSPNSGEGKHLLAHELTHTVQQGAAGQVQSKREGARSIQREPNLIQRAPGLPSKSDMEGEGLSAGYHFGIGKSTWGQLLAALDEYRAIGDAKHDEKIVKLKEIKGLLTEWLSSAEEREGKKKVKSGDEAKKTKSLSLITTVNKLLKETQLKMLEARKDSATPDEVRQGALEAYKDQLAEGIDSNRGNEGQVFRSNTTATALMAHYGKTAAAPFVESNLMPVLQNAFTDLDHDILKHNTDQKDEQGVAIQSFDTDDIKAVKTVYRNLVTAVTGEEAISAVPKELKTLCYQVHADAKALGASDKGAFDMVASIVFLRVINPIIMIYAQKERRNHMKAFTILSKIFQNQANAIPFGVKENEMTPFNEVLAEFSDQMANFINTLIFTGRPRAKKRGAMMLGKVSFGE